MRLGLLLVLCAIGALVYWIPNLTRREILFGVSVPADFRESQNARGHLTAFRAVTALAVLFSIVWVWFSPDAWFPIVSLASPFFILLIAGLAFAWQHRRVAPFAIEDHRAREADLGNAPERLPSFVWFAPGAFLLLLIAAVYVYLHWAQLPERFPVHWALSGQPNRWRDRTPLGVYGPILFGVELCAWMLALGLATWFGARRSKLCTAALAATIVAAYAIALLLAAETTGIIVNIPVWLVMITPLVLLAPIIVALVRAISEPDAIEPTPNECWKGGLFYYNPNDAALFVERRAGIGFTFNFGNKWSWLLVLGLAVVIGTAPLLV